MPDLQKQAAILESVLKAAPVSDDVRADAWDAFFTAPSRDAFVNSVKSLPLDLMTQRRMYYVKYPEMYPTAPPEKKDLGGMKELESWLLDGRQRLSVSDDPSMKRIEEGTRKIRGGAAAKDEKKGERGWVEDAINKYDFELPKLPVYKPTVEDIEKFSEPPAPKPQQRSAAGVSQPPVQAQPPAPSLAQTVQLAQSAKTPIGTVPQRTPVATAEFLRQPAAAPVHTGPGYAAPPQPMSTTQFMQEAASRIAEAAKTLPAAFATPTMTGGAPGVSTPEMLTKAGEAAHTPILPLAGLATPGTAAYGAATRLETLTSPMAIATIGAAPATLGMLPAWGAGAIKAAAALDAAYQTGGEIKDAIESYLKGDYERMREALGEATVDGAFTALLSRGISKDIQRVAPELRGAVREFRDHVRQTYRNYKQEMARRGQMRETLGEQPTMGDRASALRSAIQGNVRQPSPAPQPPPAPAQPQAAPQTTEPQAPPATDQPAPIPPQPPAPQPSIAAPTAAQTTEPPAPRVARRVTRPRPTTSEPQVQQKPAPQAAKKPPVAVKEPGEAAAEILRPRPGEIASEVLGAAPETPTPTPKPPTASRTDYYAGVLGTLLRNEAPPDEVEQAVKEAREFLTATPDDGSESRRAAMNAVLNAEEYVQRQRPKSDASTPAPKPPETAQFTEPPKPPVAPKVQETPKAQTAPQAQTVSIPVEQPKTTEVPDDRQDEARLPSAERVRKEPEPPRPVAEGSQGKAPAGGVLQAQRPEQKPQEQIAHTPGVKELILSELQQMEGETPSPNPVKKLRSRPAFASISKQDFDRAALELMRDGRIYMAPHDRPATEPPAERESMVQGEDGTHYVSVTLTPQRAKAKQENAQPPETPKPDDSEPPVPPVRGTYSIKDHADTVRRMASGEITAQELKDAFAKLRENEEAIKAELMRKPLSELAPRGTGGRSKQTIVDGIYQKMLERYAPNKTWDWKPYTEPLTDAIKRAVDSVTDDDIKAHAGRVAEQREALKRIQENKPQTLDEYRTLVRAKGEKALTDEQLAEYDRLVAAERKQMVAAQTKQEAQPDTGLGTPFSIVEGFHEKKLRPTHVAQLKERVPRETFEKLEEIAKKHGGYYSSYKGGRAVPGFQFETREAADAFASEAEKMVPAVVGAEGTAVKAKSSSSALRAIADAIESAADKELSKDRLTNTPRRVGIANRIEGVAIQQKRLATAARSIADAIESGNESALAGVKTKAQLSTLASVLDSARYARMRSEKKDEPSDIPSVADARYAEFPWPSMPLDVAEEVGKKARHTHGLMARGKVINAAVREAKKYGQKTVYFRNADELEAIETLGKETSPYSPNGSWIKSAAEGAAAIKRLRAAGIETIHDLRQAVRELAQAMGGENAPKADESKLAERELVGKNLEGFFPTPEPIVKQMIELAAIAPGMRILEPSAGTGSIANGIAEQFGDSVQIDAYEINGTIRKALELNAKKHGYTVVGTDFLSGEETQKLKDASYQRILMNPPFERGQDIEHVRRAYDILAPGGRIVAIMSEGPFFRSDKASTEFREWLESVGGTSQKLPEGSFKTSLVPTGVNARIVVIDKLSPTDEPPPVAAKREEEPTKEQEPQKEEAKESDEPPATAKLKEQDRAIDTERERKGAKRKAPLGA